MAYSEADTKAKLITPKLNANGWGENHIVREYYFTAGRKLLGNKRGKRYFVDYLLSYNNTHLAIVEAKAQSKDPLDGLQQCINYAQKLKIDYVYSTNGNKIYEHSLVDGKGQFVENYPSPTELFNRKYGNLKEKEKNIVTQPFHIEGNMKPRFYQQIAVQKTVEALAKQKNRVLLTLATGTGKTYIAFQIVYRLFHSHWNKNGSQRRPKILFLADRNVLKSQAMNQFNDMEKDCVEITGKEIKKRNGVVPRAGNVFFAIYQSLSSANSKDVTDEEKDDDVLEYYKQYPKEFFDLVVIDECHRGSANDQSSWRAILEHFESAAHLGLTATPKRDDNGDTYAYFGEPIYEYSLKEGINDGFLTPYKVKRVQTNIDEYKFDPNDMITGELQDNIVKLEQFEKEVVIPKRTELIAKTIVENINPMDKTIVFCVNQKHSLDMKIAIDKFKSVKNSNYCVRVTSDEGEIGRDFLEKFQDNDLDIPTILTSSKMLTTGVDAKNVRNVVLTAPIKSMTEFKQIIGRGTRVFEGKDFFTIIDFVGATNLFYDKAWDDDPLSVDIKTTSIDSSTVVIEEEENSYEMNNDEYKANKVNEEDDKAYTNPNEEKLKNEKVTIDIKGKKLKVINIETTYVGEDGKPLRTQEYLKFLIGILGEFYDDEKKLRAIWSNPSNRKEMLNKLFEMGIDESQLYDLKQIFEAQKSDIYDVLAHLSFNLDIKTRAERALSVENSNFIQKYHNDKAKEFIEFILDRYKKDGVKELDEKNLSALVKLSGNDSRVLKEAFGNFNIRDEYFELQREIYR
jgi:type I restriction enzyme R subunit